MEESLNFNFETTDKSQEILTNEYTQYISDLDFFEGSELALDGQNENDITPIALDVEHSEAYDTTSSSDIFSVGESAAQENSALISESELDSDVTDEFTGEHYGYETVLDQAESEAVNHLREFSQDSNLKTKLEEVFGEEQNFELTQKILKDLAQEGSLSPITIEVLDSGVLDGANGAYAESTETIYLSDEFLTQNHNNPNEVTQVLLEEFGHHLDAQINETDTPGDEGAIFADMVYPKLSLSAEELAAAAIENDYGVIYVDGLNLGVEQSSPAYPGYEMQFNSVFVSTKDQNVETWQEQLIALGYDLGEGGADGYFGEDTDAATRQFQRDRDLEEDGIVGSQSWAAAFPCESEPTPVPEGDDIDYIELVPLPDKTNINSGLITPNEEFMLSILGDPNIGSDTFEYQDLIETRNVGPFTVEGLIPMLGDLEDIFAQVQVEKPQLYEDVMEIGMLVRRSKKDSSGNEIPGTISNHSWGTAIDLFFGEGFDLNEDGQTNRGLVELAPYFQDKGYIWGAGFSNFEDSGHFEASEELIQQWQANDWN